MFDWLEIEYFIYVTPWSNVKDSDISSSKEHDKSNLYLIKNLLRRHVVGNRLETSDRSPDDFSNVFDDFRHIVVFVVVCAAVQGLACGLTATC